MPINALREFLEAKIDAVQKLTDTQNVASDQRLTQRLDDLEKSIAAQFRSSESAISVALEAAKEKAEQHNQLIAHMKDQSSTMLTRAEALLMKDALDVAGARNSSRLDKLELRDSNSEGHGRGLSDGWKWLLAFVGLGLTLATLWRDFHP